ncbi:MAG: MraY family glycosyltransferase [Bacteroides sp.]|uniref:MraY family glycosyltransferase n=1 Tax=Bacteroides sp. TaxID=29523 RepID=UPI002FC8593F
METIIIPRVLLISKRKRLYDIPDDRKSHRTPIPRLAGITFFPVLTLIFLPMTGVKALLLNDPTFAYSAAFIIRTAFGLCGCMVLVLMGIKDDLIGVRYSHKFILQIIAAFLLVASGTYLNNLYGLLGIHEIPYYMGIPLSIILIVYIINSINLIDGVDGLAATLSSIAALVLGGCLLAHENYHYTPMAFALGGILVPFIYYNTVSKRKIFMGDTGSLTLGYILALLAIHYSIKESANIGKPDNLPIVIAWSVLFIPMFDTARVMCVRAARGKSMFQPDRNHIHHKLMSLGYKHKKITRTLALCSTSLIVQNLLVKTYFNINLILMINIAQAVLYNIYLNQMIKKRKSFFITNNSFKKNLTKC